MLWFTCTPKHFVGNQAFMDRDSGLVSAGFRDLGQNSRAVQLAPALSDDLPDVIRATQAQMEDVNWWLATGATGVVLFSYGSPTYQAIADAIVIAGLKLVQMADTHGVISPWADAAAHLYAQWHHHWHRSMAIRLLRTLASIPYSYLYYGLTRDPKRVQMMTTGDYFCGATPASAERYRRMVRRLGSCSLAGKVQHVPIPVGFHFDWPLDGRKSDEVVAVGRWDSVQKRTPLLMTSIRQAAKTRPATIFRIFGIITPELVTWHNSLPQNSKERVKLEGKVSNAALAVAYIRARVMLVSAAYEGCHISSAEALCCGATVVACKSPFLCALEWHASQDSGQLAKRATGESLGSALVSELEIWDQGMRDPSKISRTWRNIFLPDKVASRILGLFENK
jgi:hypothetical protein